MNSYQRSIGRNRAIALFESNWWVGRTAREIAKFQLFTRELCVPFGIFRHSLEETLGRPVWLHEFGLRVDELAQELLGERDPPTSEELIRLVPREKLHGLFVDVSD